MWSELSVYVRIEEAVSYVLRKEVVRDILPAKRWLFEVEPRGVEPLTSAVQRRHNTLLEVSRACKLAAKARISFMALFPSVQVVDSGCCTVAAQTQAEPWRAVALNGDPVTFASVTL